jgi:hypothetical protein
VDVEMQVAGVNPKALRLILETAALSDGIGLEEVGTYTRGLGLDVHV